VILRLWPFFPLVVCCDLLFVMCVFGCCCVCVVRCCVAIVGVGVVKCGLCCCSWCLFLCLILSCFFFSLCDVLVIVRVVWSV